MRPRAGQQPERRARRPGQLKAHLDIEYVPGLPIGGAGVQQGPQAVQRLGVVALPGHDPVQSGALGGLVLGAGQLQRDEYGQLRGAVSGRAD